VLLQVGSTGTARSVSRESLFARNRNHATSAPIPRAGGTCGSYGRPYHTVLNYVDSTTGAPAQVETYNACGYPNP
jgi:hypothetical protein